jgi:integrase
VSLAEIILPGVREHLAQYVDGQADAFVFTGPTGAPIRRGNLNKLLRWQATVAAMGAPGLHFHDLRHTGTTLAVSTGASLRDLVARMGHDSPAAAMIYQHATSAADRAIAAASIRRSGNTARKIGTTPRTGQLVSSSGALMAREWHAGGSA